MSVEAITAFIGALSGMLLGFGGLWLARRRDAVAAASGMDTASRAGYAQAQATMEAIAETYQEDNREFREQVKYLNGRLDACHAEREALRIEVARLVKKYGNDNGG